MDNHVYQILQVLLEANNIYINYKYLANELDVSLRTINRKMKSVEDFLKENNYKYDISSGKGIKISLMQDTKKALMKKLDILSLNFISLHERLVFITIELLTAQDYLTVDYFATMLKVSRNTIQKDLNQVEKKLNIHELILCRHRGKGIKVTGDAYDYANLFTILVFENLNIQKIDYGAKNLININSFHNDLSPFIKNTLLDITNVSLIEFLHSKLENSDSKLRFELVDGTYLMLLINISNIYELLPKDTPINNIKNESVKNFLEKLFNPKEIIPNSLAVYLSNFFVSARISGTHLERYTNIQDEEFIENQTNLILEELIKEFKNEINITSKFIKFLESHLSLFIKRYNENIQIPLQYTDNFLTEYKVIADRVKNSLIKLGYKDVLEDEIVYIAIHILGALLEKNNVNESFKVAVVCFSGFGTSHVLKETLMKKFNQIDIESIYTTNNINELNLIKDGVELIISTVPIEMTFLPTILVNPIINDLDVKNIENALKNQKEYATTNYKRNLQNSNRTKELINDILNSIYYKEINEVTSLEELISIIVTDNFIEEDRLGAYNKILTREKFGSSILNDYNLLLLHTRFKKSTRLGVVRLQKLFYLSHNNTPIDTVLFMIVPEQNNKVIIDIFSKISEALITEENFIKDLKTSRSEELLSVFEKAINIEK